MIVDLLKSVNVVQFNALIVTAFLCCAVSNAQPASPVTEFESNNIVEYSTRGHVKSKGAVFSMKVPKSWAVLEGERSNIVQKFVSEGGKGLQMAMIVTKSIPSDVSFNKDDIRNFLSANGQREMLPEGVTFVAAKSSMIEAEPAGMVEYTRQVTRADSVIYMHVLALTFFQGRTMVQVQFQVGGVPSDRVSIEKQFVTFRPLFQLMMNSIVFEDKWK